MISRDLATELKAAGLERHNPQQRDLFWVKGSKLLNPMVYGFHHGIDEYEDIWLPTLSDLLAEIEARGWEWELRKPGWSDTYCMALYKSKDGLETQQGTEGDTPEEAAAKALLWVLKEEGKDNARD